MPISPAPGDCGDIQFYPIEVKFDNVRDGDQRRYFKRLPTTFKLDPIEVDRLRMVAKTLLEESPEYRRLLKDLR